MPDYSSIAGNVDLGNIMPGGVPVDVGSGGTVGFGSNNPLSASYMPSYTPPGVGSSSTPSGSGSSALGGLAGTVPGLALGIYQTIWGSQQLNKLHQAPAPQYSVSPELSEAYSRATSMKDIGLTAGEKASAQSDINRGAQSNYDRASKMAGGNMANALQGAVNSEQLGAYDRLAAVDADTRRKNLEQYYKMSNDIQGQRNLIQSQQIQQRNTLEQQYGAVLNQGISGITSGASGIMSSVGNSIGSAGQLAALAG